MLYAPCLPKLKELRDETLPTHVSSKACYLVSEQVAQGYGMGEGMNNKELIHELRMCVSEELCDLAAAPKKALLTGLRE